MNKLEFVNMTRGFDRSFGLYIHIPFCLSKCRYCDFYSEEYRPAVFDDYLEALIKEIRLYGKLIPDLKLETIYIGGGTPSLLKPAQLDRLVEIIISSFSFPRSGEISLECNPVSLNKDKIKDYLKAGVNRLSLGVQSFQDQELSFLGRVHTSEQAIDVIKMVKDCFDNFNLDLIFALPGQSLTDWQRTIKKALSFNPPHLSLYNLQLEENTPLGRLLKKGEIKAVDDKLDAEMYLSASKMLQESGLNQYEISNFSRPGFESVHNKIYWRYEPYLGLGPSAHSFNGYNRFYNYSDIAQYIKMLKDGELPVKEVVHLSRKDRMAEMFFMGLRLIEGVSFQDFEDRFNLKPGEVYKEQLNKLTEMGLLNIINGRIRLTEKGVLLGNEVFMEFV